MVCFILTPGVLRDRLRWFLVLTLALQDTLLPEVFFDLGLQEDALFSEVFQRLGEGGEGLIDDILVMGRR